ncbi:MAG: hypothetical protein VKK42_06980 [Lyngbya sp.]|nr:hypothetical protein [Lyngbya sp.]
MQPQTTIIEKLFLSALIAFVTATASVQVEKQQTQAGTLLASLYP